MAMPSPSHDLDTQSFTVSFPILPSSESTPKDFNLAARRLEEWQPWLAFLSVYQALKEHWTPNMAGVLMRACRDQDDPSMLFLNVMIQWQDGKCSNVTPEEREHKYLVESACSDQLTEHGFELINELFATQADGTPPYLSLEECFEKALQHQPRHLQAVIKEAQLGRAWEASVGPAAPKPRF